MAREAGSGAGQGSARVTPAMAQYREIRAKNPGAILFFRIGDFYETFGEDAVLVSRELEIALTSRSRGHDGERIPLAGVPYHAADGYIARLVAKGYRVAVCDQVGDPRKSKGIVKRELVRVVTPGTAIDPAITAIPAARYLMAVQPAGDGTIALAFLDVSTGEFFGVSCSDDEVSIRSELVKYRPAECIAPEPSASRFAPALAAAGVEITPFREDAFSAECADEALATLDSREGGEALPPALRQAAGAALRYARENGMDLLVHISPPVDRSGEGRLVLDAVTLRNLEVLEGVRGPKSPSLRSILDRTRTPMGGRLLTTWLAAPLLDPAAIDERLDAVAYFASRHDQRLSCDVIIGRLGDLPRIAGRISYGNAGPRDLCTLRDSLARLPLLKGLFGDAGDAPAAISRSLATLGDFGWVCDLISHAIADEPPPVIRTGGVIRQGYNPILDEQRSLASSGKGWIAELQRTERERTGIRSLKVGYTSVFGYYLEVSKANIHLVPPDYERKQTTTSGERYTTPALREREAAVAAAEERVLSLESELYTALLASLRPAVPALQMAAGGIAMLDIWCGLAALAIERSYVRPVIDERPVTLIRDARHPVVELQAGGFVPNDAVLSSSADQVLILTGANMAGKSTYMRSVALCTVMAQTGSFVPARSARIGVADRIFTRVGAFDDLASGQSTFMVEMLELAHILTHATGRSLVILDEIGRGTSTLDGYCIAQAVLERLHGKGSSGPRTLFATHFHELIGVETIHPRVRNYHFAVRDKGTGIEFLRKLVPGATDRSYGIHVAELAGVPAPVIRRANEILGEMMRKEAGKGGGKRYTQMLLADMPEAPEHPVIGELRRLDPDAMTPLTALTVLHELKSRLEGDRE
jgi:DNA mismatch repair protein MutS